MIRLTAGGGPFPLPCLPVPTKPASASRRVQQRYNRTAAVIGLTNDCLNSLNTLSSCFSLSSPFIVNNVLHAKTSLQQRFSDFVFECADRFVRRRDAASVSQCGDMPEQDFALQFDAYHVLEKSAVPIVADRVALPSDPGGVRLLDLLPPDISRRYEKPDEICEQQPRGVCTGRRAAVCGTYEEYVKLVRRMRDIKMLGFLRKDEVRTVCGLFGVPKDDGMIRLIIDARPANAVFKEPPKVNLPTPDLLTRLRVRSDRLLFIAKIDVDNFYHRLAIPDWLQPYFALPAVRASDVGLAHAVGSDVVYPCCLTLPMGWTHSVFLAQAAHEHFIDSHTTKLRDAERLTRSDAHNLCLVDELCYTCYIDDITIFSTNPAAANSAIDEYLERANAAHLKVKLSKLVRPTEVAESCGFFIDGREHTVGVAPLKLQRLCMETRVLLGRGCCSGEELQRLVGKWSWAVLARRPAFAVFNAVYRFCSIARERVFSIWPSVRREMEVICGLAPLLFTRLDVEWFSKAVATDASSTGMGVVSAACEDGILMDFAKKTSKHGCAEMTEHEEQLVHSLNWRDIVSAPWKEREHINVLELRAASTAVRWVLSHPSAMCRRLLVFCDSQVVIPSVLKGRCSSFRLLCRMRFLSSLLLASGLQIFLRYIRSRLNPADEPSRRFE